MQTDDKKVVKQKGHTYYEIDDEVVDLRTEVEKLLKIV